MGPVIEAIDAGHFEKTLEGGRKICRKCGDDWECEVIKIAKRQQPEYAKRLEAELKARARGEAVEPTGLLGTIGRRC